MIKRIQVMKFLLKYKIHFVISACLIVAMCLRLSSFSGFRFRLMSSESGEKVAVFYKYREEVNRLLSAGMTKSDVEGVTGLPSNNPNDEIWIWASNPADVKNLVVGISDGSIINNEVKLRLMAFNSNPEGHHYCFVVFQTGKLAYIEPSQ